MSTNDTNQQNCSGRIESAEQITADLVDAMDVPDAVADQFTDLVEEELEELDTPEVDTETGPVADPRRTTRPWRRSGRGNGLAECGTSNCPVQEPSRVGIENAEGYGPPTGRQSPVVTGGRP